MERSVTNQQYISYILAFCVTIIRYYDYALFGLSAFMLAKNFIPEMTNENRILLFFTIYGLTMFVRPLGSLLFGYIADHYGRINSIKISTIVSSISVSSIAIIPSFEFLPWFGLIMLTIFRMLFLLSLAGELDTIKIYLTEKTSPSKRNFIIGVVSFFSQIGVLLASIMYHITVSFEQVTFLWRLNFLLGGILGLIVIIMRSCFFESKLFLRNKSNSRAQKEKNIFSIIKNNKTKFMLSMLIHGMSGGVYRFLIIFLCTFLSNVACIIDPDKATLFNIKVIILYSIASLISGYISDKVDMIKQTSITLISAIVIVIFIIINNLEFSENLYYILVFLVPFYYIPCISKIQSLFSINSRVRMFSISHAFGGLIFSTTTPVFCTLIWKYSESVLMVWSYLLGLFFMILLVTIILYKKSYKNMFDL